MHFDIIYNILIWILGLFETRPRVLDRARGAFKDDLQEDVVHPQVFVQHPGAQTRHDVETRGGCNKEQVRVLPTNRLRGQCPGGWGLRVHSHLKFITRLRFQIRFFSVWEIVISIALEKIPILEPNVNRNRNRVINLRCEWTIRPYLQHRSASLTASQHFHRLRSKRDADSS